VKKAVSIPINARGLPDACPRVSIPNPQNPERAVSG
jgi:hypothetical protein